MTRTNIVDKEAMRRHMFGTYTSLRIGMAVIAFAYPILLYFSGRSDGINLQGSISAYYWASNSIDSPVRIWFAGGLLVIAAFLYLYKGFTIRENIALNFAAAFAIGVVYFPMEWNCNSALGRVAPQSVTYCFGGVNPHGISAVALFACLVYVVFRQYKVTLPALNNPQLERIYERWYWLACAFMIAGPASAVFLHVVAGRYDKLTFFLEVAGIYGFVAYWIIKSLEMRHSQAEANVLRGAGVQN